MWEIGLDRSKQLIEFKQLEYVSSHRTIVSRALWQVMGKLPSLFLATRVRCDIDEAIKVDALTLAAGTRLASHQPVTKLT